MLTGDRMDRQLTSVSASLASFLRSPTVTVPRALLNHRCLSPRRMSGWLGLARRGCENDPRGAADALLSRGRTFCPAARAPFSAASPSVPPLPSWLCSPHSSGIKGAPRSLVLSLRTPAPSLHCTGGDVSGPLAPPARPREPRHLTLALLCLFAGLHPSATDLLEMGRMHNPHKGIVCRAAFLPLPG